jgi:hypothetical protein
MAVPFCLPLNLMIHQGLAHIGKKDKKEKSKETFFLRYSTILDL